MKHPAKKRGKFRRILFWFSSRITADPDFRVGFATYARPDKPWDIVTNYSFERRGPDAESAAWKRTLADPPNACIGAFGRTDLAAIVRGAPFPVLSIYGGRPFRGIAQIGIDDIAIGRMAAGYLADRGYRHFGFFAYSGRGTWSGRWFGFRQHLAERGLKADRFCPYRAMRFRDPEAEHAGHQIGYAVSWLHDMPKPLAVFACNDVWASWVADGCRHLGLRVPDDTAILGVDEDPARCLESYPPISSIALPRQQLGFEAAKMIDRMMAGTLSNTPVLLPPKGVVSRQSTDAVAVDDINVACAMQFIRDHAKEGIGVDDVVRQTALSRRYLEKRFREVLGISPFLEIRNRQIDEVSRLLRETGQKLEWIAERTGFSNGLRLGVEFKKHTGQSPGQYRRQFRGSP